MAEVFKREYSLQHMTQRHHEVVRLALLGRSNNEIAAKLGFTPSSVSLILNNRMVKDKLDFLRAQKDAASVDVMSAIRELAPKCIEVLESVMDNEGNPAAARVSAAKDVLDRAGFAAPKVIQTQGVITHLTLDELNEIKQRAMAYGIEAGVVIDE